MMDTKLAVASLGLEQYRTRKQQCYLCYVYQKKTMYPNNEYSPIIIQDLNDIFVHSQKFFFSAKKIVYHLFLLLILPNIVLY